VTDGWLEQAMGQATQYRVDLHQSWWARTVSNRRPLVCKSEPYGLTRFTRCHRILKCTAQRLAGVHPVPGLAGCVSPSWHTLGTTGVWSAASSDVATVDIDDGVVFDLDTELPSEESRSGWIAGPQNTLS
jgi:hypothetical protein